MKRPLFCEICPLTYKISTEKEILKRKIQNWRSKETFCSERSAEKLPELIFAHQSTIRRRLGNVDMRLQENKATNLQISAPKVTGILIRPGETFSFWSLVGRNSAKNGYKEGMTIQKGEPKKGVGGGMCQFSNLIHWMVLHSDLTVTERHHHDQLDLFPDNGRTVPFGTGTSIVYNYRDYRFKNETDRTYQLLVWTDEDHLFGELRAERPIPYQYNIYTQDEKFVREADGHIYRTGTVVRETLDAGDKRLLGRDVIQQNHARVVYEMELDE
ncbi:MAG: VanW family protein [Bacteroidales bacterium]|nr:VanW family protein [Bacteroidales bacterium]